MCEAKGMIMKGSSRLGNEKHFTSLIKGFSDAFSTGKFCDVKVVCQDSNLWAHRVVLGTVSPFLKVLLEDFERRGDDVITIYLPMIKAFHMKLVLDYIYSGAMYLCGAHMQFVIQVMEVLQLKCGVSVNKMVVGESEADKQWIEVEHSAMKIKSGLSLPDNNCPVVKRRKSSGLAENDQQKSSDDQAKKDAANTETSSAEVVNDTVEDPCENSPVVDSTGAKDTAEVDRDTTVDSSDVDEVEEVVIEEAESVEHHPGESPPVPAGNRTETIGIEMSRETDVEEVKESESSVQEVDQDDKDKEEQEEVKENGRSVPDVGKTNKEDDDDDDEEKENIEEHRAQNHIHDSDSGNSDTDDMVMVEVDEEFVVEPLPPSQDNCQSAQKHKCVLCNRIFRYYENLQIHLTGHLGVKVSINRCRPCKRNFKNKMELDLHLKSHSYARHLGKYRKVKSAEASASLEARIITTTGTKEKKILRKYLKKDRCSQGVVTRQVVPPPQKPESEVRPPNLGDSIRPLPNNGTWSPPKTPTMANSSPKDLTCKMCDKNFVVRSLYQRHMQQKHSDHLAALQNEISSTFNAANFGAFNSPSEMKEEKSEKSTYSPSPIDQVTVDSPGGGRSATTGNPYSRQYSTPGRKRKVSGVGDGGGSEKAASSKKKKQKTTTPASKKSTPDRISLQCPDCDRVFPAKSILERHLKTAKHGSYSLYSSDSSSPGPAASTLSPSRKCECHLCGMKFMRVRDLAKHREKVCSAWQTPGN